MHRFLANIYQLQEVHRKLHVNLNRTQPMQARYKATKSNWEDLPTCTSDASCELHNTRVVFRDQDYGKSVIINFHLLYRKGIEQK